MFPMQTSTTTRPENDYAPRFLSVEEATALLASGAANMSHGLLYAPDPHGWAGELCFVPLAGADGSWRASMS